MYFIYLVSRNTFSLSPLTDALLCWGGGPHPWSAFWMFRVQGWQFFFLSFYVNVNKNAAAPCRAEQSMSNGMNGDVRFVFDSSLSNRVVGTEIAWDPRAVVMEFCLFLSESLPAENVVAVEKSISKWLQKRLVMHWGTTSSLILNAG